jgi:RNA polymerase sigma-70 factor (ECF subfamily)
MTEQPLAAAIENVYRAEYSMVLAALIAWLRDIELAEDVLHDALVAALETWPQRGIPHSPGAWLTTAARRKAIDRLRRSRVLARKEQELAARLELEGDFDMPREDWMDGDYPIPDERLKLIFTCCHPALAVDVQVALTLQTMAGLTAAEIARAFLTGEATMAQRLVRAKRKIRDAGIPFSIPPAGLAGERIAVVFAVIYLIFNEGYAASSGASPLRERLCDEAIHLGRELLHLIELETRRGNAELQVFTAEALGLLALMLLHHARRAARVDAEGQVVVLEEQDRSLWDRTAIVEGASLLDRAASLRNPGPYQVQAAISAEHARAATADDTNWVRIAALYAALRLYYDTPVVRLNQAVAVAMADGPWQGLNLLQELQEQGGLEGYFPFYAARADLLRRAGALAEATAAYAEAVERCHTESERLYLQRRLQEVRASAAGGCP